MWENAFNKIISATRKKEKTTIKEAVSAAKIQDQINEYGINSEDPFWIVVLQIAEGNQLLALEMLHDSDELIKYPQIRKLLLDAEHQEVVEYPETDDVDRKCGDSAPDATRGIVTENNLALMNILDGSKASRLHLYISNANEFVNAVWAMKKNGDETAYHRRWIWCDQSSRTIHW